MQTSVRLAYTSLFALFAVYAAHRWFGPDIFYHLSWGRDLVRNGSLLPRPRTLLAQPLFANVYWLFQLLVYFVNSKGQTLGITLLFALVWASIGALWLKLTRPRGALGPVYLLVFLILVQLRFEERPEVFAYLFILLLIWRLERLATTPHVYRGLLGIFVLQNLWTGFHGYFALGPLIAGAFALGHPKSWRRGLSAIVVTGVASVSGAFGTSAWQTVAAYAKVGRGLRDLNGELFAPTLWPLIWPTSLFWFVWAATLALLLRGLWRKQNEFSSWLALGGILASVTAVRNLPLLPLLAAPLWRLDFEIKNRSVTRLICGLVVLGAAVLAARFIAPAREAGDLSSFGLGEEWASYPIGVSAQLEKMNFKGRLFTDSYDGGYLEWHLPEAKVLGDSYFSDVALTREYFAAIKDPAAFAEYLRRFDFDALVLNVENYLIVDQTLNDTRWHLAYADSHHALFLPAKSSTAIDPARVDYRPPASLANRNHAFGPATWAAIAAHRNWRDVLRKILGDMGPGEIPASILLPVYGYALAHGDRDLLNDLAARSARADSTGEANALEQARAKATTCCH